MFGACYYPEHWPRSAWQSDAEQMAELGIERQSEYADVLLGYYRALREFGERR